MLAALLLCLFWGTQQCYAQTSETDSVQLGNILIDSLYADDYDIRVVEKMEPAFISINNLIGENNVENIGKIFTVNYVFTNPKTEPIVIKRISVSCACIETIYPKTILREGQSTTITFKIEITNPGPFKANVIIYASNESLRFIKISHPITITN